MPFVSRIRMCLGRRPFARTATPYVAVLRGVSCAAIGVYIQYVGRFFYTHRFKLGQKSQISLEVVNNQMCGEMKYQQKTPRSVCDSQGLTVEVSKIPGFNSKKRRGHGALKQLWRFDSNQLVFTQCDSM